MDSNSKDTLTPLADRIADAQARAKAQADAQPMSPSAPDGEEIGPRERTR